MIDDLYSDDLDDYLDEAPIEPIEQVPAAPDVQLNASQQKACEKMDGPVLVVAGAGSGKTRTLIERTARLVTTNHTHAANILILTFTNRAADEIKLRLEERIGSAAQHVVAGTFHSILFRELIQRAEMLAHGEALPETGYQFDAVEILDETDSRKKLKETLSLYADTHPEWAALWADEEMPCNTSVLIDTMDRERALGRNATQWLESIETPTDADAAIGEAWQAYEAAMRQDNQMDFDEILVISRMLLAETPGVAERFAENFTHLMVDEYQDTNPVQGQTLDLIVQASPHRNIFVVGDEKQSIYKFRGSDIGIILGFEAQYPETLKVSMPENYRSTQDIIHVANACARNMREKLTDGALVAESDIESTPVVAMQTPDEWAEAKKIVAHCQQQFDNGATWHDIAVLYRNRYTKMAIEREMLRAGLPYVVAGDRSFWGKATVRDTLAFLTVITSPWHVEANLRMINASGSFGVSRKRLAEICRKDGISIHKAMQQVSQETTKTGLRSSAQHMAVYLEHRANFRQMLQGAYDPNDIVIRAKEFWLCIMAPKHERKGAEVLKSVEKDFDLVMEVMNYRIKRGRTWPEALSDMQFLSEIRKDEDSPAITLSTIHAAKGLEWEHVHLAGMNNLRKIHEDDMEEERRTCYVGLTRARKTLDITWPVQQKHPYKKETATGLGPNEFVQELERAKTIHLSDWRGLSHWDLVVRG